jgi:hypothetical protein
VESRQAFNWSGYSGVRHQDHSETSRIRSKGGSPRHLRLGGNCRLPQKAPHLVSNSLTRREHGAKKNKKNRGAVSPTRYPGRSSMGKEKKFAATCRVNPVNSGHEEAKRPGRYRDFSRRGHFRTFPDRPPTSSRDFSRRGHFRTFPDRPPTCGHDFSQRGHFRTFPDTRTGEFFQTPTNADKPRQQCYEIFPGGVKKGSKRVSSITRFFPARTIPDICGQAGRRALNPPAAWS